MTTSEETDSDQRRYVSAGDDRPYGYSAASWWPFVTAIGAAIVAVGVGVFIVGANVPAIVDASIGLLASLFGVIVALSGVTGWVYQGFVKGYREKRTESSENRYLWGMLLYFPVELALIGAGALYFALVYYSAWPPGDLPPIFIPLIWIMSIVLLVSSFTNYFASRALETGSTVRFLVLFAATPLLGVLFLAGKVWNWYRLIVQEGYWIDDGVYWTAFFGLDGLHGLLVVVGIVFMTVVLARALKGHYSPNRHVSVTTATWYWWIVDSIWFVLLVELYGTVAVCRSAGMC